MKLKENETFFVQHQPFAFRQIWCLYLPAKLTIIKLKKAEQKQLYITFKQEHRGLDKSNLQKRTLFAFFIACKMPEEFQSNSIHLN